MCVCAELVYNFLISSLYKAIYGQTYFYPRIFVPRSSPYLSSGNFNFNLIRPFAHTNYADCTFVPNVIMHWNNLPNSVKSSSSDRFLYLKFLCINTYLLKTYCLMLCISLKLFMCPVQCIYCLWVWPVRLLRTTQSVGVSNYLLE